MKNSTPNIRLVIGSIVLLLGILFTACSKNDTFLGIDWDGIIKSDADFRESNFAPYEPKIAEPPLIQFVVNEKDSLNKAYSKHIEKVADYTKIPFQQIKLADWNAHPTIAKSTRVLCLMETNDIKTNTIDTILHFIAKGGTVFVSQAITDIRFGYLAGLKTTGDLDTDITSKGIHFTSPFLPNMDGKDIKPKFGHYSLKENNFSSSINVLATASNNPKLPVVIENKIGRGKVIYFNSTMYLDKEDRGFLFSYVLSGLEGIPYPIANTSTIFLDDFPSPLFEAKLEPIASEMNINTAQFETKIWWPDIKYLAHKYHISLTAIPCFDYENTTNPPFDFTQWDSRKIKSKNTIDATSSWLMKDCLANGNELGFHGYNHVSLEVKGWDKDYIPIALNAVEKKWEINDFGDLPRSYVPPSNVIDQMGVGQLRKGIPSLQFMCSLYSGEKFEGGDREFDFEPYDPTLFDYPRLTAGFYMDEDRKFSQQSMYLYTGIWTHFIHPDDIYQINSIYNKSKGNFDLRNKRNLGWRTTKGKKGGMFYEFDNYLNEITHLFPQIRFLNANTAGNLVYNWRASAFKHTETAANYTVERRNQDNTNNQYWFLYVTKANVLNIDEQLKKQKITFSKTIFQKGYLYTILTPKGKISIENLAQKEALSNEALQQEYNKIKAAYSDYLIAFKTNYDFINGYTDKDSDELEMKLLRDKLVATTTIDYASWNTYADYMSWKRKPIEVWNLLKSKCEKSPSVNNINYSQELDKTIGYPNAIVQEYWLNKQIEIDPKNTVLLKDYIDNFNSEANAKKITKAYQKLLKIDFNSTTYTNYIEHIIAFDSKAALKELANVTPNDNLKGLAESITWLFADNKEFKKALAWSKLTNKIDFKSKLYWLESLKDYDTLETQYLIYISKNPTDYGTRAEMSRIYLETNRFKEAWIIANSLPNSSEKKELQKTLNSAILDVDSSLQKEILNRYPQLLLPEVKAKIQN
jgi:hypothetical protein